MTGQFVGARLEMARHMRGLTVSALAGEVQVSAAWITKAEHSQVVPSLDLIRDLAKALDLPVEFFSRPMTAHVPDDAFHFRATSRLTQRNENTARALSAVAMEMSRWIDANYAAPQPAVPEVQDLLDAEAGLTPEEAANALRGAWGLGWAPVSNLTHLLEAKGARVFSAGGPMKAVDAFSFRDGNTPVIFLNVNKSPERLRFDLAHELGHLVMHGGSLAMDAGKEKEQAANEFASAFLMPRADVVGSMRGGLFLEDILRMKRRWKVSAMALNLRLNRLGITTEWTYGLLAKQLSSAGFRRAEPGSDLVAESSQLLSQVMSDLRIQGKGFIDLARELDVRAQDVRDLLLGLVTFAMDGVGARSERSQADLRVLRPDAARVTDAGH